jgi:hypothetical protein
MPKSAGEIASSTAVMMVCKDVTSGLYLKYLYIRHTGESRYPVINQNWMPVFTGMTTAA